MPGKAESISSSPLRPGPILKLVLRREPGNGCLFLDVRISLGPDEGSPSPAAGQSFFELRSGRSSVLKSLLRVRTFELAFLRNFSSSATIFC